MNSREYKIEEAVFPKMIAQVAGLQRELSSLPVSIGYQIRKYPHDRRFFVLVHCYDDLINNMSDRIKQVFPEARCTSKLKCGANRNKLVFSAMM